MPTSTNPVQKLCAHLRSSVHTHVHVQLRTSAFVWWNVRAKSVWLLKHFVNELLPWHLQPCEGCRHGNRLLTSYYGRHPGKVPRCWVSQFLCLLIKVCQGKVESTSLPSVTLRSLQWWRVSDKWYLNLCRGSLMLHCLTLHLRFDTLWREQHPSAFCLISLVCISKKGSNL